MPLRTKLIFGVGAVAFGIKESGLSLFLLLYYGQVLGLPEKWVGAVLLVALLIDAVSDPWVGQLSDRTTSRWGRRHPFMVASALPVCLSYYFLWNPPTGLSPQALLAYLLAGVVLVRVSITFNEIPSSSLAAELTTNYHERTRVFSYRFFFGWCGGLTMNILTFAVLLRNTGTENGLLLGSGYRAYGSIAACVMLISILVSAVGTRDVISGLRGVCQPAAPGGQGRTITTAILTVARNKTLRPLLASSMVGMTAAGLGQGLEMYIGIYFWQLTPGELSLFPASFLVAVVIACVGTEPLARRLGKRTAAQTCIALGTSFGVLPLVLALCGAFPSRQFGVFLPLLLLAASAAVCCRIATGILFASMVTDLVEVQEVETGLRAEGTLMAVSTFVCKTTTGLGVFAAGVFLSSVGFPRQAAPGVVPIGVVDHLIWFQVLAAGTLGFASAVQLRGFDHGRADHERHLALLSQSVASAAHNGK